MMKTTDRLAEIEGRAEAAWLQWENYDDPYPISESALDVLPLASALRAVLELHLCRMSSALVHVDIDPFPVCTCGGSWPCRAGLAAVTAITAALGCEAGK